MLGQEPNRERNEMDSNGGKSNGTRFSCFHFRMNSHKIYFVTIRFHDYRREFHV